MLTSYYLSG